MNEILGIVVSYLFVGIVLISAKLFQNWGEEDSRKYVHILLSNWWFIAMCFFKDVVWVSFVPLTFVIINYLSYRKNLISVMERNTQDGLGTVYYAISLFILSIISFGIVKDPRIGLAGTLVMGYGDGFAAIIGQKIKSKEYKIGDTKKSVFGSITMFFITSMILSFFFMGTEGWYIKVAIVSFIITMIEAISIKGIDNITVPLITAGMVYLCFSIG